MKTILILYVIFIITTFVYSIMDFYGCPHTPKDVYESNNCNMFGAVFLWIIAFVLDPLFYVAVFLWWIFHVGIND